MFRIAQFTIACTERPADPPSISKLITGATLVNQVGRNYLAGEYDWTGVKGGDDLANWLATIRTLPGAGDIYWSLFGRSDSCCGYVEHNDGESFFYQRQGAPTGSMWPSDIFTRRGRILAEHSSSMSGRPRKFFAAPFLKRGSLSTLT